MPYTPPAQHSPALPAAAHHYFEPQQHGQYSSPRGSASGARPALPRSRSSSAASKKRQEEELAKNTAANIYGDDKHNVEQRLNIDTSVRQSPPPVTDAAMPAGALISPPDSGHNSSDEEGVPRNKAEAAEEIKELEKAVRESLQINRKGSPEIESTFEFPPRTDGQDMSQTTPAKLSHTAKKIAHSRSSTDSAILLTPPVQDSGSPGNTSVSDGSEEDDEKPPLIRKKSGELVKPAIRPRNRRTASSAPGTPTYGKKGVHFNDEIQQVKHFLQVDRPIAVSAGGSPVEVLEDDGGFPFGKPLSTPTSKGLDIRLCNFPRESLERQSQPVRLDKIILSPDQKSLVGHVVVANIDFHKQVVARFTFDSWRTTSEVLGEYNRDPARRLRDGYDLFTFTIKLSDQANIEQKTMFICVRYSVNGRDYWDNNNNLNFHVDFIRGQSQPASTSSLGTRPIPRSRRSSSTPRPKSMSSFDEDFSRTFDSMPELKLKQPAAGDGPPIRRQNPSSQQFGMRYDFGTSLTAALNHAQSTLGDRSGLKTKGASSSTNPNAGIHKPPGSSISKLQRHTPDQSGGNETPRPETLHANRTSLDSRAYQEFVSKFCFFGSGKPQSNGSASGSSTATPQMSNVSTGHDGTLDETSSMPSRASEYSATRSDAKTQALYRRNEPNGSVLSSHLLGRTGGSHSPSPDFGSPTGYDSPTSSPAPLGYGFDQNSGLFSSGTTTPATAIQG